MLNRLSHYSGLFLLLSSVVINLIACYYSLLGRKNWEKRYLQAAWITALVISVLWGLSIGLRGKTKRLKACMGGAVVGTGYGWTLGIVGIVLLKTEKEATEEAALVLLNVHMQFLIGCVELCCFFVYMKQHKAKQEKNKRRTQVGPEETYLDPHPDEGGSKLVRVPQQEGERMPLDPEQHMEGQEDEQDVPDNSWEEPPPLEPVNTGNSDRLASASNIVMLMNIEGRAEVEPHHEEVPRDIVPMWSYRNVSPQD